MTDKRGWGKPAAWAITQNEKLWSEFDSVADRSVIIGWSLGDNYRTEMMEPGDRTIFWITGKNGGIARMGFVLNIRATPGAYWEDSAGRRHDAPYTGTFYLPPFPNRRYIHRSAVSAETGMVNCELLSTAAQSNPPLRIEPAEWKVVEKLLVRFDRTSYDFRAPWGS